jgi:hypothetical protein
LIKDPAILYQEYLEQPDMFEEETGHLLLKLVGQQKKLEDLTDDEMKKLDEAVVSFIQYTPKKPEPKELPKPLELDDGDEEDEEEVPWGRSGPSHGSLSFEPPEDVSSFWWKG